MTIAITQCKDATSAYKNGLSSYSLRDFVSLGDTYTVF
jgi:hypothetical protein